ncbi:hypothetical protein J2X85_000020 [Microbacterium trichothecenolyticum]|uniref:hypothetical protein n=1 Tax=Microbacterium trichothecenolyticum TaxID=69370 RepID=UPI0028569C1B|nr:hypothetical protein [Microbacterium trichothecenolyticum]MDR7182997.1 hypothetical protein [Microbacterium trichothecenolyticum]
MTTSHRYLLGGLLFLVSGFLLLVSMQPVWWSVASVVIVFSAAALLTARALTEWRKTRADM